MIKVAFLVNGAYNSPMAYRARSFAARLAKSYDIRIAYRTKGRFAGIVSFASFLFKNRPTITYVFDMASSGVLAAVLHKSLTNTRFIVDVGDSISDLARSMGRGRLGVWLTDRLQEVSLTYADIVVVRGSFHRDQLRKQHIPVELIPDGVDVDQFAPRDSSELRREKNLDDVLTVCVIGSSIWNEKLQMCYGWDLVETVRLLKEKPVKAILIGDGSGIARLKTLSQKYGIESKMLFLGFIPYDELPLYLSMMDVCLSTQTNDLVGKVRTTGKLPLYLASGRYILASDVGEASLVLKHEMLVPYDGAKDDSYPSKLAERIIPLIERKGQLGPLQDHIALAREQFDYSVLSKRVASVIESVIR